MTKGKSKIDSLVTIWSCLGIVAIIAVFGNYVGYSVAIKDSIPGMLIILGVAAASLTISTLFPSKIPWILYCMIIGMLLGCPWNPLSPAILKHINAINSLATSTCCLGFAGVTMAKRLGEFKRVGWRGVVVVCFLLLGTYLGSAIIAQIVLKLQGLI